MTDQSRWRVTPARRLALAGGAVMLLLAVAVAVVLRTRAKDSATMQNGATAGMQRIEGMEDMPGMQLMPRMEGATPNGAASVRLSPEQIRTFGVTFGTVAVRTLQSEVRTVAVVTFDETRITAVAPRVGGFVERLHVDFTGSAVRAGQALLDLYSPELLAAQEEILLAKRLQEATAGGTAPGPDLLEAGKQRLRLWGISDAQIAEILRTGRARRALTLHAPASGIVTEKNVVSGQAVAAGETLYTIADLSRVWVEAELREADAARVRTGSPATIEIAALGRTIAGRVAYVYPTVQEETRTLRARIVVANPGGQLKPGMYGTVRIATPDHTALTVPAAAIVDTGERRVVFVDMGGGELMPHEVTTGITAGGLTEVLSGVADGQRVVTSAQYLLDSESNLGDVMRAMMAQMNLSDIGSRDSMEEMEGMGGTGADMKGMRVPPKER